MRKVLVMMLIISLCTVIGCTDGQNNNAEGPEEVQVSVLLDWFPNTNHTGLYVAKDNGYYAEEGLEVEIIQPSEGGTSQLIAAGQGDFGVSYQEEVTIARSQELPVVAVAAVLQHNTSGFASPVDRNIDSPRDFEGKTYGGWGSPAETAILEALMQKDDADFNKINMINIGSADFFTSMEKDIDFSWIYYGWTGIEAESRNIDLDFMKLTDVDKDLEFYTPVLIANENTIAQNPELISKFLKATARGYNYAIENPEQAANILLKHVPELDKDLVTASQNYLAGEYKSDATRWGEMKAEVWDNYMSFMYENGLIDSRIKSEQSFTNDYLPE